MNDRPLGYVTGRPTDYKDEYAEIAGKLCRSMAATDRQLADYFGVCVATIANWKLSHPEFLDSLKLNKAIADEEVVKSLYQRAIGYDVTTKSIIGDGIEAEETRHYPADPTSMIFWLKNRLPKEWRDKPEGADNIEDLAKKLSSLIENLPG